MNDALKEQDLVLFALSIPVVDESLRSACRELCCCMDL